LFDFFTHVFLDESFDAEALLATQSQVEDSVGCLLGLVGAYLAGRFGGWPGGLSSASCLDRLDRIGYLYLKGHLG